MSSEWQTYYIKDMGKVVTGKTPSTSKNEYFNGDIPFLTPTDMKDGCKTVTASRSLTNEGLKTVKNCLIPKGVAVSCIGWQMGKAVLVLEPTVTNQQINTIVVNETRFDLNFIYYSLSSMREKIFQYGATATRTPIVNKSSFENFTIVAPSLKTQKEISKLFSAIDDRIALLRETNTTLESIAHALFKSWFVDFDPVHANVGALLAAPDFAAPDHINSKGAASSAPTVNVLFPSTFVESPLGLVPEGWGVESLDSVANFLNGLALQKFPPNGINDLPVIKIAQLRKGDTVGADKANRDLKPEYVVQNGDVLFSWSGSLEVEIWCGGEGALNQHLFKVTSSRFRKWFFYLWTKHHLENFKLIAASKATTMGHIQRKHLSEALVVVPCREVISVANETFEPLIEQIINNALAASNLARIRDSLLPRLISGQLRLPEVELN